jgi:hypothetical protein
LSLSQEKPKVGGLIIVEEKYPKMLAETMILGMKFSGWPSRTAAIRMWL